MKIVIAGALTLAVLIAFSIPILKKKKGIILALYALGMIVFFAFYNFRTMEHIIKFYNPTDQTVYQKEFLADGEYTDAFLDEYLNGKTVYTKDDAFPAENTDVLATEQGNYWLYGYYYAVNAWNYLDFNHARTIKDATLNDVVITDDQRSYFKDLGSANDMMRYTFPITTITEEWGNGFYYYWFYNARIGDSRVYVCPEGLEDTDTVVFLWQREEPDTDSYFIASKEFIDGVIRK